MCHLPYDKTLHGKIKKEKRININLQNLNIIHNYIKINLQLLQVNIQLLQINKYHSPSSSAV